HTVLLANPVDERRCVLCAKDGDRERLRVAGPVGDAVHHQRDDDRKKDRAEEDGEQRAAVAERVAQLLAEDDDRLTDAAPRRRERRARVAHAVFSRRPASETKASSRFAWPDSSRNSSGVPSATT